MAVAAAAALIQFRTCPAAAAAPASPPQEQFSGIELPQYGDDVEVSTLFSRPDGGIVIKYHYRRAGVFLTDYYDVSAERRLVPQIEAQLAHSHAAAVQIEKANGLKPILPMLRLDLGGQVTVEQEGAGFEEGCSWPYLNPTFSLSSNGKKVFTGIIFVRLKKPQRVIFKCKYEADVQPPPATIRYGNPTMDLYPDGRGGFYGVLFELPYVIHFDHSGRTKYFLGRNDLIEMPSGPIEAVASKAGSLPGGSSWQPSLNEAERLVDRAAKAQQGLK
jgi:hypothetical protein